MSRHLIVIVALASISFGTAQAETKEERKARLLAPTTDFSQTGAL